MRLSPLERLFGILAVVTVAYKFVTGRWPVGVTIEEVDDAEV
jgi:hypothetical protein